MSKSAFDYFKDEKIVTGWNMGDTLDAHENGVSGETVWGNPKASQKLFDGVKEAGFDIVRIPVTWMGHFGNAPEHLIKEPFLQRVAEVSGYAHNAGLKVIINMHHDGMTENPGTDLGWHSINKSLKSRQVYDEITFTFSRIWKQIAEYFADYGDWLLFESMNEIHDGRWGHNTEGEIEIDQTLQPQMEIINNWNLVFTDTIRSAGGNNTNRYLVLPGYCTVPQHTTASYFVLPKDSTPNKQIVSFHYYDPYEFGILGTQPLWGSPEDKQRVDEDFSPFKECFIDKKIPVIIGESGAVLQLYRNKVKTEQARQSRLDYIGYIYKKAREYELVPMYWDNGAVRGAGDKFGLINRKTGKPNSPVSEAVIKAMTK